MNKCIKKSLNIKLMIVSLIIISLTLISDTTIVNANPIFKSLSKYSGTITRDINEIGPIKHESGFDWSDPDKKAIYSNLDGHIFELNAKVVDGKNGEEQQYITIDEYDSSIAYLSSKIVLLPYSKWGGFYNCEDGNFYVVVGQNNTEEDDKKVVYSVIKYNSEWKEIKRVNITGKESKTLIPFVLGRSNISFNSGRLVIEDVRKPYSKLNLNNNEEAFKFSINTSTMKME